MRNGDGGNIARRVLQHSQNAPRRAAATAAAAERRRQRAAVRQRPGGGGDDAGAAACCRGRCLRCQILSVLQQEEV